ncbi:MAG: hypothetical protein H6894_10040 [Defluviimonas sp.]|nr:hypothetical protein [Defluviimonas sp.]
MKVFWKIATLTVAAGLALTPAGAARAVELDCARAAGITADAPDPALAEMTCEAAAAAKALMAPCGLVQTAPIRISVVKSAEHPSFGTCLAIYDARSGCLEVTEPEGILPLLAGRDARDALPVDVLFRALTVHELAHAFTAQTAGDIAIGPAEQEFIANVFEMMSLPPEWREQMLAAHPVDPPGALGVVHPSIYALAPRAFANNAWRLFEAKGNGCALVQRIVTGEFAFPAH